MLSPGRSASVRQSADPGLARTITSSWLATLASQTFCVTGCVAVTASGQASERP
jgi:hypothetical protein